MQSHAHNPLILLIFVRAMLSASLYGKGLLGLAHQLPKVLLAAFFTVQTAYVFSSVKIVPSPLSNKLYQLTITDIFSDSRHHLWIGTLQGLYRFDGAEMYAYDSNSKRQNYLEYTDIRGIIETPAANLVITTFEGGLFQRELFDYNDQFSPAHELSEHRYLSQLFQGSNGDIWVSSRSGISVLTTRATDSPTNLAILPNYSLYGEIYDFLETKQGEIMIGGSAGLFRFHPNDGMLASVELEDKKVTVTALAGGGENTIYIGSSTGEIIVFDLESSNILYQINLGFAVTDLTFYQNRLWIGTDSGLFQSDSKLTRLVHFSQQNSGLKHNHITKLFVKDDVLWVGTFQGLHTISSSPFDLFNRKNSDIHDDVLSFSEDTQGTILVGTYKGLYQLDPRTGKHDEINTTVDSDIAGERKLMTTAYHQGLLWLGYWRGGVKIYDTRSKEISLLTDFPQLQKRSITAIHPTNSNNAWIATYDEGLFRLEGSELKQYPRLKKKAVTVIFVTQKQETFVVAENEIYKHDVKNDQFIQLDISLNSDSTMPMIMSSIQLPSGDIVLGTKDKGLFVWPSASQEKTAIDLQRFSSDDELDKRSFYGIQIDSTGNLWCSTQRGLVKLDSYGNLLESFSLSDGLQGNDFNFGASFKDSKGNIYFGGVNGYNRFQPNDVFSTQSPSPVVLTGIELYHSSSDPTFQTIEAPILELDYQVHSVNFHFTVLDFRNPEKNQFKYKLEGFDTEWVNSGYNNIATYTNLPAGEYTLRVQGANSAGIWNEAGLSLAVRVLPPPWKTWWAYCIYLALFYAAAWACKRVYDNHVIKVQALVYAEQMHRAADRAEDDLQEYHETQDELVRAIYQQNQKMLALVRQSFSDSNVTGSHYSRRLEALSILEDCYFYQSGGLLADLRKFTDTLITRRLPLATVKTETISVINNVSENLAPADVAASIALVIDELLENTLLHAFNPQASANYIQIDFDLEEQTREASAFYRFCFRDNGVGTPHASQKNSKASSGTEIVHALAAQMNARVSVSNKNGSLVEIEIPQV